MTTRANEIAGLESALHRISRINKMRVNPANRAAPVGQQSAKVNVIERLQSSGA